MKEFSKNDMRRNIAALSLFALNAFNNQLEYQKADYDYPWESQIAIEKNTSDLDDVFDIDKKNKDGLNKIKDDANRFSGNSNIPKKMSNDLAMGQQHNPWTTGKGSGKDMFGKR